MKNSYKKILVLSLLFIAFIVAFKIYFPVKYYGEIKKAGIKYNIEEAKLLAIIKTESGFREKVESYKGARGLMQVMPNTAKWIVKKKKLDIKNYNLYNYKDNIEIGSLYYSYLAKRFDHDFEKILVGYNAGISRVLKDNWRDIKETKHYVKKVKVYTKIYRIILKFY